jgi:hypothetical protein
MHIGMAGLCGMRYRNSGRCQARAVPTSLKQTEMSMNGSRADPALRSVESRSVATPRSRMYWSGALSRKARTRSSAPMTEVTQSTLHERIDQWTVATTRHHIGMEI